MRRRGISTGILRALRIVIYESRAADALKRMAARDNAPNGVDVMGDSCGSLLQYAIGSIIAEM